MRKLVSKEERYEYVNVSSTCTFLPAISVIGSFFFIIIISIGIEFASRVSVPSLNARRTCTNTLCDAGIHLGTLGHVV